MKIVENRLILIFLRYLSILVIALFAFSYFYKIFLPLTIYPANFLLNLCYNSQIQSSSIIVNNIQIVLIEACIAGSAYFLLLLLNLSVPMKPKTRFLSIIFSLALFLALNIARIFIFSILYINNFKYFEITHLLFWYLVSGVFVFLVWLVTIRTFKIKEIPFYTDLHFVYKLIKQGKK